MKQVLFFISLVCLTACSQNNSSGSGNDGKGGGTGQILLTKDLKTVNYDPLSECTMQSLLKGFPFAVYSDVSTAAYFSNIKLDIKNVVVHLTDATLMGKNDLAGAVHDSYLGHDLKPVNSDEYKERLFFGLDVTVDTSEGIYKVVSWDFSSSKPMPYLYAIDPALYYRTTANGQPADLAYSCLSTVLLNLPNPNWQPGQNRYLRVARMALIEKNSGLQNDVSMKLNELLTSDGISQTAVWSSMARNFHP